MFLLPKRLTWILTTAYSGHSRSLEIKIEADTEASEFIKPTQHMTQEKRQAHLMLFLYKHASEEAKQALKDKIIVEEKL